MEYRADGLPRSDLMRAGGFLSGIVLATPLFFVLFAAAASVLSQLPIDASPPGSALAPLVFALAAATVASATSLFGYDWVHAGSRLRAGLFAGTVVATALAGTLVTAFLFADALAWGLDDGSVPVVGVGGAGLLGLAWAAIRSGRGALAGYRNVE